MITKPAILVIGEKEHALKWSLIAQYRLQTLPTTSTFGDLLRPERAVAASLNFGWAMLPPSSPIASPEAFAIALEAEPDGLGLSRLDDALANALEAAFPGGKKADAKKASTDSLPAPESSSG